MSKATQLVSHRGEIRTQAWPFHRAPHPGLLSMLEKTPGNCTCVGNKAAQLIRTSSLLLLARILSAIPVITHGPGAQTGHL